MLLNPFEHSPKVIVTVSGGVFYNHELLFSIFVQKISDTRSSQYNITTVKLFSVDCFFPRGRLAVLGGSAISRQPVVGTRQASFPQPGSKN